MPIEIKEMHIKINVSDQEGTPVSVSPEESHEEMIQECLDQMTKMLNDKEER
ncbi:MAG: DUF5908 family protein [Fluviicola sp.]